MTHNAFIADKHRVWSNRFRDPDTMQVHTVSEFVATRILS